MYVLLFLAAALCAYFAQRCFAGARGAGGAGRLRWQARGFLLAAGTFGLVALAFLVRSPAIAIGAAGLAIAAVVAAAVLGARARGEPRP